MNANPTVLIVDDEAELREVVAEYLEASGFAVAQAENGLEALLKIKRLRPRFVVLDLTMPRLGGVGGLKRIRTFDPAIRVIVVTGTTDEELHRQARAQGAAFVFPKPVEPSDLLAALRSGGLPTPEPAAAPAPPAAAGDTVAAGWVLVVDDDAEMRATLEEVVARGGHAVRTAADGAAAVRVIAEEAPDVVLLDINMPGLSGVDALPTLRALAPETKIIMVSGEHDPELAKRALAHGAFDYVTKPVDLAYLTQSLETALMMRRLETP